LKKAGTARATTHEATDRQLRGALGISIVLKDVARTAKSATRRGGTGEDLPAHLDGKARHGTAAPLLYRLGNSAPQSSGASVIAAAALVVLATVCVAFARRIYQIA